jgi:hypothetical protein
MILTITKYVRREEARKLVCVLGRVLQRNRQENRIRSGSLCKSCSQQALDPNPSLKIKRESGKDREFFHTHVGSDDVHLH